MPAQITLTCHSLEIIASSQSKIACILYKFFPDQNKNYWKDPPKIPGPWKPGYILAQLIHSYPVCNIQGFKGENASPSKGPLQRASLRVLVLYLLRGCCWLLQLCTIMGNKDNICPQSQARTNILSTSKSSLIWRGRRGWVLSCTHGSCWEQGEEMLGESSSCVNLTYQYPELSVKIQNTSSLPGAPTATTPHHRVMAPKPSCCLSRRQLSKPGLGLGKVFCGYFGGGKGLPCCDVCFYAQILHR